MPLPVSYADAVHDAARELLKDDDDGNSAAPA
jgi:hypothetical protein